jgi:hypothetical protein
MYTYQTCCLLFSLPDHGKSNRISKLVGKIYRVSLLFLFTLMGLI